MDEPKKQRVMTPALTAASRRNGRYGGRPTMESPNNCVYTLRCPLVLSSWLRSKEPEQVREILRRAKFDEQVI